MNPHNLLTRQGAPPKDAWHCKYCNAKGTLKELEAKACTYVYPPCDVCGQTPECAPDCGAR